MKQTLKRIGKYSPDAVSFVVVSPADPRLEKDGKGSFDRCRNILPMVARAVRKGVHIPDGTAVNVYWSPELLIDDNACAKVGKACVANDIKAVIFAPDTWAFPGRSVMRFLSHLPKDTPILFLSGNSGPKPGNVLAYAAIGALAQNSRLAHLVLGHWPDTGQEPKMTDNTASRLVDWCYAAMTYVGLKAKVVFMLGHDSMEMETAINYAEAIRRRFGIESNRRDMKWLSDRLKKVWDARSESYWKEMLSLESWLEDNANSIEVSDDNQKVKFRQSLLMYLIVRDAMKDLNAVGGGFTSQLDWGSDKNGIPLPVADIMESLFNTDFDHTGPKIILPYATECDMPGLLTMLFLHWLSGGCPPLFLDFRKVWRPEEIHELLNSLKLTIPDDIPTESPFLKGYVDGDNSGSASFRWAAKPGASMEDCMKNISFPQADEFYFPGGGNSVTFQSPGGIEGIIGRMAFVPGFDIWSFQWDEMRTVDLPLKFAKAAAELTTATWPHSAIQCKNVPIDVDAENPFANHKHAVWNPPKGNLRARVQYWLDMTNVVSANPWMPRDHRLDRTTPVLHSMLTGGDSNLARIQLSQRIIAN